MPIIKQKVSEKPFEGWWDSRHWAIGVFLVVLAMRLISAFRILESHFPPDAQGDMEFYHGWALRVLGGVWSDGAAFYGLPGYAYFLAGIYWLVGPEPALVVFLQCFVEAGTALLIFAITRLILPRRAGVAAGVLAGLGWGFYPAGAAFAGVLMPTSWAVFGYWGMIYWAMKAAGKGFRPFWPWAAMGVCAGVIAMGVATVLFVLPLAAAAGFIASKRRPLGAAFAGGSALLGAWVGMAPCWAHNRFVAGDPVLLSAHSGINFFLGNNPEANGYPRMPLGIRASQSGMLQDSITLAEEAAGHPLKRSEVSRYWSDKAKAFIREQPWAWAKLMVVKVRNLWSGWEYDDLTLLEVYRHGGQILPGPGFGVVVALGVPGLVWACTRRRAALWVAAGVLLHMAALMPVFVTERYRSAMVPGLMIGGAFGLQAAWGAVRAREWRWPVLWSAGVAVMAWVAAWKPSDPRLLALAPYNAGIKLLAAEDLEEAAPRLERAAELVPNNGEVQFALGNLRYRQKRPEAAREHYLAALELIPEHVGARQNLGVIAMEEGDAAGAAEAFDAVLALEPKRALTWRLLGECRAKLGDIEGARAAVARALELAPDDASARALEERLLDER